MNSIFDAGAAAHPYVKRAWIAAIILALLQTAIIGYTIESHASILQSGTEVVLKTAPIDPRDLLRGDYVILNYEISSVPASTIVGGLPKEAGEQVLSVRLHKDSDGFWRIAESSFGSLEAKPDTVVLKSQPFQYYPGDSEQTFRVEYGIERYYVPEGEGAKLETARSDGQLSIAARISGDGQAQIRTLLLDGQPVYEEPLY
ncbi:GDYXXLXY domain-containing protein [Rhizobium sp. 2YAF20]|uniref:GDYXXLXY domain-containing protein n=1 Tax=Rhizobium sp. 2YAF20 TaxID=3233027 RepID=UPI003F980EAE